MPRAFLRAFLKHALQSNLTDATPTVLANLGMWSSLAGVAVGAPPPVAGVGASPPPGVAAGSPPPFGRQSCLQICNLAQSPGACACGSCCIFAARISCLCHVHSYVHFLKHALQSNLTDATPTVLATHGMWSSLAGIAVGAPPPVAGVGASPPPGVAAGSPPPLGRRLLCSWENLCGACWNQAFSMWKASLCMHSSSSAISRLKNSHDVDAANCTGIFRVHCLQESLIKD